MISIITPTYNHQEYIGACIDSVLAQTYSDWEMIIIDDGSTDSTGDVITRYKDSRIKYVRQENKGIYKLFETYNAALNMAKGEYIAILEGDDYWPDYKLELQVDDFKDNDVVLSFGYTQSILSDGTLLGKIPIEVLPVEAKTNIPIGRSAKYMMSRDNMTFTFPVSVLMRKKALERIGGFQQPPYLPLVDYPTFLYLTLEGKFVFHDKILGFWRRHGQSITENNKALIYDGVYRFFKKFYFEKSSLLPISQQEYKEILSEWDCYFQWRWNLLGRSCLFLGEWAKARKAYKKSLRLPFNFRLSGLSMLGVVLSYCRIQMEPLFCLMKKPTLDKRVCQTFVQSMLDYL